MCVFKVHYIIEWKQEVECALSCNIDHMIKYSIVIGCAFSQSGKVTICAFDSILRLEYIR